MTLYVTKTLRKRTLLADRNIVGLWGRMLMSLMLLPWPVKDWGSGAAGYRKMVDVKQGFCFLHEPLSHTYLYRLTLVDSKMPHGFRALICHQKPHACPPKPTHVRPSHTHMHQRRPSTVHNPDDALLSREEEQRGPRRGVHTPLAHVELLRWL